MHRYARKLPALLGILGCFEPCACGPGASDEGNGQEVAVTLRLRPTAGQRWREHWVYDLDAPGRGLSRTAVSFDVAVARPEPNSAQMRQLVKRQFHRREGKPAALPDLTGAVVTWLWGPDRSLLGDFSVDAGSARAAEAVRELVAAARFGTLIEYPDQAVGAGDSWSIEPRTLTVGPGLLATLRPSYVLEAIANQGSSPVATIDSDIQVDLAPRELEPGVVVEGGGTASGSLRVRASDGVLLEASTIVHFNQEVRVQNAETLGYREFSATTHVFVTRSTVQPDLASEPSKLEPADPDEERACAAVLDAVAERVGRSAAPPEAHVLGILYTDVLPAVPSAPAIREPGSTLVLSADGKRLELAGVALDMKELSRALRSGRIHVDPLYLLAPTSVPVERLRSLLSLLPQRADVRLIVRARSDMAPPKAARFVEDRLRAAIAVQSPAERQARLSQLLSDHLALCEGALSRFRAYEKTRANAAEVSGEILREMAKCGCTATQVDGLEISLQALFGSTTLRGLRLPPRLNEPRARALPSGASLQALVALYAEAGPSASGATAYPPL